MRFPPEFIETFNYCRCRDLYLGTGNPDAKILIIGKECARKSASGITAELLKQWERELVAENLNGWEAVIHPERISENRVPAAFPVRFPYPGQKNKVDRLIAVNPDTEEPIFAGGTSDTWVKYQRLCDKIYNEGNKSETINFHDRIFITELNQIPSAYSAHQDKNLRRISVKKREQMFRECSFFRQFPVTILACGHYPAMMGFDIEKTFDVEWDKKVRGEKNQFYNLHFNHEDKRILIHTRQMSMAVTNSLIGNISEAITPLL